VTFGGGEKLHGKTALLVVAMVCGLRANNVQGTEPACNDWCQQINTRMFSNALSSVQAHYCGYPGLASELQAETLAYIAQEVGPDQFYKAKDRFSHLLMTTMKLEQPRERFPAKKEDCERRLSRARGDLQTTRELMSR
jgi:hypothetical protein